MLMGKQICENLDGKKKQLYNTVGKVVFQKYNESKLYIFIITM